MKCQVQKYVCAHTFYVWYIIMKACIIKVGLASWEWCEVCMRHAHDSFNGKMYLNKQNARKQRQKHKCHFAICWGNLRISCNKYKQKCTNIFLSNSINMTYYHT